MAKKGFEWGHVLGPDGQPTGTLSCYPSDSVDCIVIAAPPTIDEGGSDGLLTLSATTQFHDGVLMKATGEINAILRRAMEESRDRNEAMHILLTAKGPLLAWVSSHVSDAPTPEDKAKLLGLC